MSNTYYSLTFRTTCLDRKFGDKILNSDCPLTIGQKRTEDIVLPCSPDLLPETFATILPEPGKNRWCIVRRTDFYDIKINGEPLTYAKVLQDGDVITFHIAEKPVKLLFHICDDEHYSSGNGITYSKVRLTRKSLVAYSLLMLLLVSVVSLVPMYLRHLETFNSDDLFAMSSSVYQINVDSVMLQMHTPDDADGEYHTVDSRMPDESSYGTCFFTKDSLCVTARHCVEPWLAYEGWTGDENIKDLPTEVQWTIMSERSQEEDADTLYRVISHCSVMDGDSCICSFTSDQCKIDRSRDEIIHLGSQQLPWRAIFPLFNRRDVELGDFAFLKSQVRGDLTLAESKKVEAFAPSKDCRLVGYPKENTIRRTVQEGRILDALELGKGKEAEECIRLEVRGNDGDSGGPVIVKSKGHLYVVGILSKKDDHHDGIFFAVPITEITNYKENKDEAPRYRR